MSDAYICDRCGSVGSGDGTTAFVGEKREFTAGSKYHSEVVAELCDDCWAEFCEMVAEWFGAGEEWGDGNE